MFTRILVPLDGSAMAERALPVAERIVSATGATGSVLRLVCVHQPGPDRSLEERYLQETAARVERASGVSVTWALLDGLIGPRLAEEVTGFAADLVVMTTHGRGPVSRFWMGSVADELIRTLDVPVLLLQAGTDQTRLLPRRILVPLDGSPRSETSLDFAVQLARLSGGSIDLLQVVPPITPMVLDGSPMTPALVPPTREDLLRDSARDYLEMCASRLRARGIATMVTVVTDASPARAIVETADQHQVDLVAIATHGAGGIRRMVLGSVADKVLRSSRRPLLVFRPPLQRIEEELREAFASAAAG